ncbi:unnamed protein product [Coffea canephora]|uniref:Amino acid transporter transmembrane domain-containing protein n=1 Tax=Coffea canephora TaxID=49390 RepID=A0A068VBZ4_COFCA|nr:unnamed protein product [Coffea canephora]
MAFISSMYGGFGILGYFAFDEETKDIITTNFGQVLLSSLVQLGLYCLWMRWVTVLGVTLMALLVPNFADFLSLVASSVCIILGFVLPALFYLIVHKEELRWQGLALDVAIVALGLAFAVCGTWTSLIDITATKA